MRSMPGSPVKPAPVDSPRQVAYVYRARVYPWAVRALRAAEEIHGTPPPTRPGRPIRQVPKENDG